MAWTRGSKSPRAQRLPSNWPTLRRDTLARDGHRCTATSATTGQRCKARATDVDHIIPDSEGGTDDRSNLTSLCRWHHGQKTASEGGRAHARKRKKAPARHPGIMP